MDGLLSFFLERANLAFWPTAFLALFGVMLWRFSNIPTNAPARGRWVARLRHDTFSRRYRAALAAGLDWLDTRLSPGFAMDPLGPKTEITRAWSAPLLDLCLLLALLYPLLSLLLHWAVTGYPGRIGLLEVIPPSENHVQRAGTVGVLAAILGVAYAAYLARPVLLQRLLAVVGGAFAAAFAVAVAIAVADAFTLAFALAGFCAVAFAVAVALACACAGAGASEAANAFALAFVGAAALAGSGILGLAGLSFFALALALGIAGAIAFALSGAVAGAFAGVVAVALAVTAALAGIGDGAGAGAVAGAGGGAVVFALQVRNGFRLTTRTMALSSLFVVMLLGVPIFLFALLVSDLSAAVATAAFCLALWVTGSSFFGAVTAIGAATLRPAPVLGAFAAVAFFAVVGSVAVAPSMNGDNSTAIVFLCLLPLLNAAADFASTGLTRWWLRAGLRGNLFSHALRDSVAALGVLSALGFVLIATIRWVRPQDGTPLLDLPALFADLRANPGGYYWLYFCFLSTLLPTILHFSAACFGLFTLASKRLGRPIAEMLHAGATDTVKARDGVLLLSLCVTGALIAPFAALYWLVVLAGEPILFVLLDMFEGFARLIGAV